MPSATEILVALLAGPVLWLAGAVFFDFVHWVLHLMLRSRWAVLRALAWPHSIHHEWIDTRLEIHWEYQNRNIWCHLLLEYLTQVTFSLSLLLVLAPRFVLVLLALQTTVFVFLLRDRGLDLNHRPIDYLDAYKPGFHTPPAYHALHHVYPDAYHSAYTKAVDWLAATGAQLHGRSYAIAGASSAVADAFRDELTSLGARRIFDWDSMTPQERSALDVLVLCGVPAVQPTEAFIAATASRKLPPEVWSVHDRPDDPVAKGYHEDVRVNYRTIVLRGPATLGEDEARGAVKAALARIRRGFNFVVTEGGWRAVAADWLRFRRTVPEAGRKAAVRHRADLAPRTATA